MKKVVFLLLMIVSSNVFAQFTKSDVINATKEVTWLGIDFTQMRFIGNASQFKDAGDITTNTLKNRYFPGWNQLFVNEQKKYDVAASINRADVRYAMNVTEDANAEIKGDLFTDNPNDHSRLNKEAINTLVKNYDFKGNKGLGMMFVVETLNKGREEASIWVVYVDMNNNNVVLAEKVVTRPGGIGFKNYWARTFYETLQINRKSLKRWCK